MVSNAIVNEILCNFICTSVTFQDLSVVGKLASGLLIDGTYGKANGACDSSWEPSNLTEVSSINFINIDGTNAYVENDDGDANAFHLVGIEGGPVTGIYIAETKFIMSSDQDSSWLCTDVDGEAELGTVSPWPPCGEIQQVSNPHTFKGSSNYVHNDLNDVSMLSGDVVCELFGTNNEVPCVTVPYCYNSSVPIAILQNWTVTGSIDGLLPLQSTNATICWDEVGLIIDSAIYDTDMCSPYSLCGETIYVDSDVLEVFLAPVLNISDAPEFYYELDAAPTGALWAAAIDDSLGTSHYCTLLYEHCVSPGPLKACTGAANYPRGLNVATSQFFDSDTLQGWKARFTIPFEMFSVPFQPKLQQSDHSKPWKTWRFNMYRTDTSSSSMTANSSCGEIKEQSSWAHVDEHFHDPPKFGVLVLV